MAKIKIYDYPKDVELAAHAIGLDHKDPYKRNRKLFYKPYRNGFATSSESDDYAVWDDMVSDGRAKVGFSYGYYVFHLTRKGLDWLGDQLGMTIYDEED